MTTPVGMINGSRNLGDFEYGKFRADSTDRPAVAVINGDGTNVSSGLATEATLLKTIGLGLTEWDSVTPTFNATSDVWVFKLGLVTKHTVTINYTSSTKLVIQNVVRS
jgi:hypothetical protein